METIRKSQFGAATRDLKRWHKQYKGRVTQKFKDLLESKGYELHELGTGKSCYTFSGRVGYHRMSNDENLYFGIGVSNRMVSVRHTRKFRVPLYRAFIKRVEE